MKRSIILAGFCLVLGGLAALGQSGEIAKFLASDVEFLDKGLAKGLDNKKNQKRLKIAAVVLAAQAGDNGALQQAALKLARALDDAKAEEAAKVVQEIKAGPKGGKAAKVDWTKLLDLESVMRAFSGERVGGLGLEKQLDEAAELKGNVGDEELLKVQILAHKSLGIADMLLSYPPEKDEGKRTKKVWQGFSEEMKAASKELAASASSKSGDAIAKAAQKLTDTCNKCHDLFR